MNTNAKQFSPLIGALLLLGIGMIGSPVLGQTAVPNAATNNVEAKKQATEYLRRARLAMKGGNLQLAERYVAQSEKVGTNPQGFLGRFSDSPAKVRKDLDRLKVMAKNQGLIPNELTNDPSKVVQLAAPEQATMQARSMMAQAKAAFDRGDLVQSEKLVQQAASLRVADGAFAGGSTPWELGLVIQKQKRLIGNAQQASAIPTNGQTGRVVPADFTSPLNGTAFQPANGTPVDSAVQRVAQQLPNLDPLMHQPAPVTLQTQALPGTGITLPGGTPASVGNLAPATAAPATISPAPPATTTLQVQPQPQTQGSPVFDPTPTMTLPQPTAGPATGFTQPQPSDATPSYGTAFPAPSTSFTSPETIGTPTSNYTVSANELIGMGEQKVRDGKLEDARDYFRQAWAMRDSLDAQTRQRIQEHLQINSVEINALSKDKPTDKDREESARMQRMIGDLQREQASINREMDSNPRVAWQKMQQLQEKLNDTDLPDATRRLWVSKLEKNALEMERYIETNRAQIELDDRNRDVLDLVDRERRMRVDVQNQLAKTLEEFNTLMDQQRYSEAYVLARQAREIAPRHEVTESMIWKSRFAERMYVENSLRDRRERFFEYSLDSSELDTPDAFTLNNPIAFPKRWEELTRGRQALMAGQGSRYSEAEQQIERALRKKVAVQFDEAPLGEVIQSLGQMTGVNVFIDVEGLAEEGVTTDTPVTMNLSQEISLRSVLNLLLGQFRLGYVIQDEVLRITSETARVGDVYPQTYYVGDLVIPIPNFMPGNTNGLAAALQQAYSVLGYGPGMSGGRMQNAPLVVADDSGAQQNVGSPLALAQMANNSTAMPNMPNMPQAPGSMGGASGADFDSLITLVTTTVEPDSWDDVGGPGTVQPFDSNLSIVVSNTQEVHDQIVDLLEQLRRLQDLQVTIEVRFITLQDNFFERIGVDFDFGINDNSGFTNAQINADDFEEDGGQNIIIGLDPTGAPTVDLDLKFDQNHFASAIPQFGGFDAGAASRFGFAILSDIETFFLLEAIQGDSRTNIMQAPKVTLFNGQFASIIDTQNRPFVTSVIPVVGDFAVAQQPVIMVLAEGTQLSVQAVVSSDRRFVRLTMMPMFSQIGDVDTFTFEGRQSSTTGSSTETDDNGDPIATDLSDEIFTEGTTVQLPNFATTSVNTVVSVPDGGTVLMGGIKRLAEGRTERGMPILSKLPYINRLFKNVGTGRETQTLMMMVTPRIIIQEEEEEKVLGTPSP